nr:MAG TPA: SOS-response transcriptional repressor [Caudoviricetes sp.]
MTTTRKRPPYREFIAWMVVNQVSRKDIIELLSLSDSTLSHRLNGTGADFTMEEVRKLINAYGEEVSDFFLTVK